MTKCLKKFGDLYSGQYFKNLDDSYFIKLSAVLTARAQIKSHKSDYKIQISY